MEDIFRFLMTFCSALYRTYGFKIADTEARGDDGSVLLVSKDVHLFFARERGRMTLEIHAVHDTRKSKWYPVSLLKRLLMGKEQRTGILDDEYGAFLREHLGQVVALFRKDAVATTLTDLDELQKRQ